MQLRGKVQAQDERLLRMLAARRYSGRQRLVRRAVPLGDKLRAWLLVTPVLLAAGRRGRRAVVSGWEAVALATALGKAVEASVRRRRPGPGVLRTRATAGRRPSSSSFPSNHTASAVAFAGAACSSFPPAAWVLGPLAGFVALSRPAAGRHYPSDVVGGIVTGALAAAVVHRWAAGHGPGAPAPSRRATPEPHASARPGDGCDRGTGRRYRAASTRPTPPPAPG